MAFIQTFNPHENNYNNLKSEMLTLALSIYDLHYSKGSNNWGGGGTTTTP